MSTHKPTIPFRLIFAGASVLLIATSFASCAQNAAPTDPLQGASKVTAIEPLPLESVAGGTEYTAKSAGEINALDEKLKPGDTLILRDGDWKDKGITFNARGTADKPITLRAQTPGKVIFSGTSKITIKGEYVILSGLMFKDTTAEADTLDFRGSHCRLTQSAVVGGTSKFFVHLRGTNNQVDHCYLAGKTSEGPTLQVEAEATQPNNHLIAFNHFGPRAPLGENGGETIRVGYSKQLGNSSRTTVRQNFFDRCDGEIEVVSNKSSENFYRNNTFFECAGMLTLRQGNRCVVDGNIFFGGNKEESGGIRVIGEDHVVTNNYIEGGTRGGFWITAGVPDSPPTGYVEANNAVVAFNTIVDSGGRYFDFSNGLDKSGRTLLPKNVVIANNIMVGAKGKIDFKGKQGEGWKIVGNLSSTAPDDAPATGITVADLKMERGEDGLLRPTKESPAIGAAQGDVAVAATDIDGQKRAAKTDIGCDEISDEPKVFGRLDAGTTGPSWMKR